MPAPVLTSSLYSRFSSRQLDDCSRTRRCRPCASSSAATTRSRRQGPDHRDPPIGAAMSHGHATGRRDPLHPGVLGRQLPLRRSPVERAAEPPAGRPGGRPRARRGAGRRLRRGRRRHLAGVARVDRHRGGRVDRGPGAGGRPRRGPGRRGRGANQLAARGPAGLGSGPGPVRPGHGAIHAPGRASADVAAPQAGRGRAAGRHAAPRGPPSQTIFMSTWAGPSRSTCSLRPRSWPPRSTPAAGRSSLPRPSSGRRPTWTASR